MSTRSTPLRWGARRRARWAESGRAGIARRAFARRVIAAGLAAGAVGATVSALAPPPDDPGVAVAVAARDLAVGDPLGPDTLRVVHLPAALVPDGAYADPAQVSGPAASPMRRGEVVTDVRSSWAAAVRGLPAGTRVAHVPLIDPAIAAVAPPGSRVDLIDGSDGSTVADDLLVVAPATPDPSAGERGQVGLFVAVSASQARSLAAAGLGDPSVAPVTVVVRVPPG